uniref:Uncharacterized protein n=1 Tax=Sphaerodactylus townsendi TaxID=933632 RepID=A0ACB8FX70_9SAUR
METDRQGDGMGINSRRSFGMPYACQRSGSGPMFTSLGGRLPNIQPGMADPFVLDKLLHTFQTMRCSVDNISQELRVVNTHLANLSHHFALAHPSHSLQPRDDDPHYHP